MSTDNKRRSAEATEVKDPGEVCDQGPSDSTEGSAPLPARRSGHRAWISPAAALAWVESRYPQSVARDRRGTIYVAIRATEPPAPRPAVPTGLARTDPYRTAARRNPKPEAILEHHPNRPVSS